jgi:hypothetical protein
MSGHGSLPPLAPVELTATLANRSSCAGLDGVLSRLVRTALASIFLCPCSHCAALGAPSPEGPLPRPIAEPILVQVKSAIFKLDPASRREKGPKRSLGSELHEQPAASSRKVKSKRERSAQAGIGLRPARRRRIDLTKRDEDLEGRGEHGREALCYPTCLLHTHKS